MMSAKVVRSLLALTLVSALAAMPALFIACGGDDDGGQSGDDNGGEADAGEPDSGGGTPADAGSSPADASPGDLDSGSTDFGPECQRYLTCCEMGASTEECEAAIEAGGSDPDAQEMFCKIAADASGCP
jgi:hypothetical protein